MNVPNIGLGLGRSAVLSRPQTDGAAAPSLRGGPGSDAAVAEASTSASDANAGFVRIGWFDVNGDGHIDERSVNDGGDATILLPHHVKVPTLSHEVSRTMVPGKLTEHVAHVASDTHEGKRTPDPQPVAAPAPAPVAVSDVQTRQAIDAYQRYGQAPDSSQGSRAVA